MLIVVLRAKRKKSDSLFGKKPQPGYYSALALRGFFPVETLDGFDRLGSILQGHPDMKGIPGVDISSGSLGQGLSCGVGMTLGGRARGLDFYTYVLMGDLAEKYRAFGWKAYECNGHTMEELVETLEEAREASWEGPVAVIAPYDKREGSQLHGRPLRVAWRRA